MTRRAYPEGAWDPVARGERYCAPACGRGCTRVEYERAHAAAEKLRASMRNPEAWEVIVHESLGWHWKLRSGGIDLHEYPEHEPDSRYLVFLNLPEELPAGQLTAYGATPIDAIRVVLKQARANAEEWLALARYASDAAVAAVPRAKP